MRNPDLKSKEQLEKEWAELLEPDRNIIKQLGTDFQLFYKNKKYITITNMDTLNGLLDTLTIFIKNYNKRILTLLKQGNKLD